jgi:hypothetical protein
MSANSTPEIPKRRRRQLALLTFAISTVLTLVSGELLVRWLDPQATMVPRSRFSANYGLEFFQDRKMVNELPGEWHFEYNTNAQGHRGPVMPVSNRYPKPNVVVLGDSYTFGYGIEDGVEYPAQLRQRLSASHGVVNLGVGGWGLTQELRRYYELRRLYEPQVVVLQFAGNDPSDNLLYRVTSVDGGRFVFHDRDEKQVISIVKRLLADSVLQHSQLYALARGHLYYLMRSREIAAAGRAGGIAATDGGVTAQQFHNELLETFARDLSSRGIRLLLIAVEGHLAEFPLIRDKMRQLQAEGLATFIDLDELFKKAPNELSPEGHWGRASHRSVAEALAGEILNGPARETRASRSP